MRRVCIAAIGDRNPSFLTHREIDAAIARFGGDVVAGWEATDGPGARDLDGADGVWLLPGTPYRDDAAAYAAIRHCLATGTPFLGTCGGFQYACVELARVRAGITDAAHAESEPDGGSLVIEPLRCSLYGERRPVVPVAGSRLAAICGSGAFEGFHYCGYGLAPAFAARLAQAGVVVSAEAADARVEAIELPEHPFVLATAFQPQVGASDSGRLHPLIEAFLGACRQTAATAAGHPGVR